MIGVPILEIVVFIQAGDLLGLWPTLGTVILTAFVGTALLRQQGISALMRMRESMEAGRTPVAEMFDGFCLLVAGALLLTPGFVTDGFGLLLFVPPLRALLLYYLSRRLADAQSMGASWSGGSYNSYNGGPGYGAEDVIDGDYHVVEEPETRPADNKNRHEADTS